MERIQRKEKKERKNTIKESKYKNIMVEAVLVYLGKKKKKEVW